MSDPDWGPAMAFHGKHILNDSSAPCLPYPWRVASNLAWPGWCLILLHYWLGHQQQVTRKTGRPWTAAWYGCLLTTHMQKTDLVDDTVVMIRQQCKHGSITRSTGFGDGLASNNHQIWGHFLSSLLFQNLLMECTKSFKAYWPINPTNQQHLFMYFVWHSLFLWIFHFKQLLIKCRSVRIDKTQRFPIHMQTNTILWVFQ